MVLSHRQETDVRTPIRITEVGPRDGLQNEPGIVSTETKIAFVNALSQCGVAEIEVGSFVSPRAIPQLADSDEVFQRIERRPGVIYSALVPNERGLERARAAAVDKIAIFTATSDTFNQRNIHCTVRESIGRFRPVVSQARQTGMAVRGYISTATHCPFEGPIPPSRVTQVMRDLLDLGIEDARAEVLGVRSFIGRCHCGMQSTKINAVGNRDDRMRTDIRRSLNCGGRRVGRTESGCPSALALEAAHK